MADSLKYGLPIGVISFLGYWIQFLYFPETLAIWRWGIVSASGLITAMLFIRLRNKAYFPYRFVFLSGFNISFVMVIAEAFLIWLFRAEVTTSPTDSISESRWIGYQIFIEAMGFMFAAIIVNSVLGIFLKRTPNS